MLGQNRYSKLEDDPKDGKRQTVTDQQTNK